MLRFDQIGYVSGGTKTAFVMGPNTLLDNGFTLSDARGQPVATGKLGASRGSWNEQYPSVHPIDFTAVTTPGTYTLAVDGVTAAPATIRIDSPAALALPLLSQNVQFFQAQRDGADVIAAVQSRKPAHLNDRIAAVYEAPTFDEDGTALAGDLVPTGTTVDVEGGWFDAGDYLKFTGTTAYAAADLLLAQRTEQEAGIDVTPGLAAEAQHGLSWLTKMWDPRTGVLYAQVGTGVGNDDVISDHDVWRLPEADDAETAAKGDPRWWLAHRPVFAANAVGDAVPPNLAGRVAAAFALAAQTTPN
ncbi:MAG TPA: glycoside hydrolase family 9 protein, partial [Mycobacterium sp.]